ncbi:MAG TPA: hypothetical protein V6C82_04465 [Chroococcales cyanobacterium]|jgi:opacity protein-like surface antigen
MKNVLIAVAMVLGLSSQALAAVQPQPVSPEKPKLKDIHIQPVVPHQPKQGEYVIQPVL